MECDTRVFGVIKTIGDMRTMCRITDDVSPRLIHKRFIVLICDVD